MPSGIVLSDPNDAEQLTNVLNSLILNETKMEKMGKVSREIALRNDWKMMSRKYLDSFEEVLYQKEKKRSLRTRSVEVES